MLQAIKDLFASKKFLVLLVAFITYVAGRFGFDVDQATLNNLVYGVSAYLLGQGIADHGKEAAKIAAASDFSLPVAKQAGFASVIIMLFVAIAGIALVTISSCGPKSAAALHQFEACAESAAAKELGPTVESVLTNGADNWKAQLTALAVAFGTDVVNCAVDAVKAQLQTKVGDAVHDSAVARATEWLREHGAT